MSNNRKEPTFSTTSHDDGAAAPLASRPSVGPASAKVAGNVRAPQARPASTSSPMVKSSPLIPLALLLALTGLGLAGFSYWQLLLAQQQVSSAEKRIEIMEGQLRLSDDESSQSVAVLQANLRETTESVKLAHSEIRKLWDTRNVNKKGISDNAESLQAIKNTANSAVSSAAAANKLAKELGPKLQALSSDLALLGEKVTITADLAAGQQKKIRELSDISARIDSNLAKLKTDLSGRLKSNEEAIQAIDGFRRQVNRDLLELKQRFGAAQ